MCRFAELSTVPIPERIVRDLELVKENDEAVRNYGVYFLVNLCRKLIEANLSPGLHFYTLNQDTVIRVIKELGLWKKMQIRILPWKMATNYRRVGESVRPVYWINRPKSYAHRTAHWKDFSLTSWSSNTISSISESMKSYYSFLEVSNTRKQLDDILGERPTPSSLFKLFYSFYSRYSTSNFDKLNDVFSKETVMSISSLPWVQQANSHFLSKLYFTYIHFRICLPTKTVCLLCQAETAFLHYGQYITNGLLITNYLPRFSGIPSEDERYGWGEKGGQIYQKEYLEFFLEPRHLERLTEILQKRNADNAVSYTVSNGSGSMQLSNWSPHASFNTLSWGLFASKCASSFHSSFSPRLQSWQASLRDAINPTQRHISVTNCALFSASIILGYQRLISVYVAEVQSFEAWREEAYGLFDSWLQLYPTESEAYQLISRIQEDYLLVSLIDNQFVSAEADYFKHIFNQLLL